MSLLELGKPSSMFSMRFCMSRSLVVASRSLCHVMASNSFKIDTAACINASSSEESVALSLMLRVVRASV